LFNPESVHKLQLAVRTNDYKVFKEYSQLIDNQTKRLCTIRGLFELKPAEETPIPPDDPNLESVEAIMKRFKSGAMS